MGAALHDFQANLLTKTGNIVKVTPGTNTDGLATKDNTAKNAKILLGSNGNTGNTTVSLNRLDTTNVVENGRVRAVVQRIPTTTAVP